MATIHKQIKKKGNPRNVFRSPKKNAKTNNTRKLIESIISLSLGFLLFYYLFKIPTLYELDKMLLKIWTEFLGTLSIFSSFSVNLLTLFLLIALNILCITLILAGSIRLLKVITYFIYRYKKQQNSRTILRRKR